MVKSGNVGRDDGVGQIPERMVWGKGLRVRDVQPGAGEAAPFQSVAQGLGVHQIAPAHIEEYRPFLHQVQAAGVQKMEGFPGAGEGGRHYVCPRKQLVQLVRQVHFISVVRPAGVPAPHADNVGPQGFDPLGEFSADVPHAQDQYGGAINGAYLALALPLVLMLGVPIGVKPLEDFQQHPKHVLGDGQAVSAGGVGEQGLGRQHSRGQIDLYPGAAALKPFQLIGIPEIPGRGAADNDVGLRDFPGQDRVRQAVEKAASGGAALQQFLVAFFHG